MIRRETTRDDGTPTWVLISQIEHARVSGELTQDWGRAPATPLPFADVAVPTIFHHDDGWDVWEHEPAIDPSTGRPRDFTEMPNEDAHAIWRRSIDSVSPWGPLAQYMVAQHFMRLRRWGDETNESDVQAFLNEYDQRCARWLDEWKLQAPSIGASQTHARAAEQAVDFLQTFDALSLILCCTPRERPYPVQAPNGTRLTLRLQGEQVLVDPWPWLADRRVVRASGWRIPAEPLQSDDELRRRMRAAESVELNWRLVPQSGAASASVC